MVHFALQHNGNYFHVNVRVYAKALAGGNVIVVKCHQGAKSTFGGVGVIAEAKIEIAFQPANIFNAPVGMWKM